jgi:drug/metabolite transporter (DMT)-like permease
MGKMVPAIVAAAFASISFGASAVVTRSVIHDIDPILLAFLRFLIASLLLAPGGVLGPLGRFRFGDIVAASGLGIIFFGLFPWFFNAGLALIPASRGALWLATMPVLTFGFAAILRVESFSRSKALGTVLTMVGIALALGNPRTLAEGSNFRGDLLLLATACCGAFYFVLSRPLLTRLPALSVTFISMVAGTVFLGCISAIRGTLGLSDLNRQGWLGVMFLGTCGGALGFGLWIWALQRSTPTRTAVFAALNPISATLLGAVFLSEQLAANFLLGFVCVLAGIVTAHLPGNRHHTASAAGRHPS